MKFFSPFAILIISVLYFSSCAPVRPVQYLEYSLDTSGLSGVPVLVPVIQKGDLLDITVYSDNPRASAAYNQMIVTADPNNAGNAVSATANRTGYLVNGDGNIIMVGVGKVQVEGMTKQQLADSLVNYFTSNKLLNNPFCDIRFLNYKVTVIGEVARPSVFNIPGERVTILEALGLAGDMTNFARRDNVTIIREINGKREFGRLDINSDSIFVSPYYNLHQNDIVVVDRTARRKREPDAQRNREIIAITTSIVSTLAIIISVFRR